MNCKNVLRNFNHPVNSVNRANSMVRLLLIVAFVFSIVGLAEAVEFVFVTPENDLEQASLRNVKTVAVRGGKALAFRELLPGESPRTDLVQSNFAKSRAVSLLGKLWDQAKAFAPAPGQVWIATQKVIPIWVMENGSADQGPQFFALVPTRISRRSGAEYAPHLVVISDLSVPKLGKVTVEQLISAKLLTRMFCHEGFHGILSELYREKILMFSLLASPSGGHDSPVETDPHLAFREGFAEMGELWMSKFFPDEFSLPEKSAVVKPLWEFSHRVFSYRQKLAARNRYIFSKNGQIKDGQLKSGFTDLSTEGVIASLLYTLLANGNWENPIRVMFSALAHGAPLTLFECVQQLIREQPKYSQTIRRILLEYTRYTICSPRAAKLYEEYYLAKKAFLIGKTDREEYLKIRKAWDNWKNEQWKRIEMGAPLFEAAPQPLIISSRAGYSLDLNDEDGDRLIWHLEAFFSHVSPEKRTHYAQAYGNKILALRQKFGCFRSLQELRDILPDWLYGKFQAGFRRYLQKLELALDKEVSRRRRLSW